MINVFNLVKKQLYSCFFAYKIKIMYIKVLAQKNTSHLERFAESLYIHLEKKLIDQIICP